MIKTAKANVERLAAPYVSRLLSIIFRSQLFPISGKAFLWNVANRNFLHHPAWVLGSDLKGNTILCRTDDFVQKDIAVFGLWEPALTCHLLRKGCVDGTFLDIGANVGYYSLLASSIFRNVIAFEASPSICKCLADNIARNAKTNIVVHPVAVSDHEGVVDFFYASDANSGRSSLNARMESVFEARILCAPLQTFISDSQWPQVKFIKIDVEGSESAVVRSLLKSIGSLPQDVEIVIELGELQTVEAAASGNELIGRICASGFEACRLQGPYSFNEYIGGDNGKSPVPLLGYPTELTDCLFRKRAI